MSSFNLHRFLRVLSYYFLAVMAVTLLSMFVMSPFAIFINTGKVIIWPGVEKVIEIFRIVVPASIVLGALMYWRIYGIVRDE